MKKNKIHFKFAFAVFKIYLINNLYFDPDMYVGCNLICTVFFLFE